MTSNFDILCLGCSKNKRENDETGNTDGGIPTTSFERDQKFLPDGVTLCTRTNSRRRNICS